MDLNMTAMTIAFIFCVAIFLYGLTLPPDKPTDDEKHCHEGTNRTGH